MSEETEESKPFKIVRLNPNHNTGLPSRRIVYNGEVITIHVTSNLNRVLDAYFHIKSGLPPRDHLEAHYYAMLQENDQAAMRVIDMVGETDDEHMEWLAEISSKRDREYEARRGLLHNAAKEPTPEEKVYRDYNYSLTFDKLSELSNGYPVADLCK